MENKRHHWDKIFSSTEDTRLGWYEEKPVELLNLLNKIDHWQGKHIFISGAGTCTLVEALLAQKTSLILNDISKKALESIRTRLGKQQDNIHWLCQDIALPITENIPAIDIWIDRAVLHFLTKEEQITSYFDNINKRLTIGGYALFAEFSKQGAEMCAGLPIHQYSVEELSQRLGTAFKLIDHFNHLFINPYGDKKPYIYALYQRIS